MVCLLKASFSPLVVLLTAASLARSAFIPVEPSNLGWQARDVVPGEQHDKSTMVVRLGSAVSPSDRTLVRQNLVSYSLDAVTPQSTIDWLDKWIADKIPDVKGAPFFPALIDSFAPLWPNLAKGQNLNFKCTILKPCEAGTAPPGNSIDQQHAWNVLVGIQNLNSYYTFQYRVLEMASNKFQNTYSAAFWNRLSKDKARVIYPAILPTTYSLSKDVAKAAKELWEAAYKASSIAKIFKVVPAVDLALHVLDLALGEKTKKPETIPNADLQQVFGEWLGKQTKAMSTVFSAIMTEDPRGPTGVLTRFRNEPDVWFANPVSWGTEDLEAVQDSLVAGLGRAFIMTYFSMTGQIFIDITDPEWNEPKQCRGDGAFNYPVCVSGADTQQLNLTVAHPNNRASAPNGWNLIVARKPDYDNSIAGGLSFGTTYKGLESNTFANLNDKLFTSEPFRMSAYEAVVGSMRCQHNRMKTGQFQDMTFRLSNWGSKYESNAKDDKKNHPDWKLYTPTLDSTSDCIWSVPIAADLTQIDNSDEVYKLSDAWQRYVFAYLK